LEEHVASIFRVKEQARQETSMKQTTSKALLGLLFNPKDGNNTFL
jgi:hypothetical protein